eukprot:s636_g19.t1
MGWEKLCKRKLALVCDSDDSEDERAIGTNTSRDCKTCKEKTCFSEKKIEPSDEIEIIDSDDSLEMVPRKDLDGLIGPDFLGTPKSKRLPAAPRDPPSGKVRVLKLRPDTPEKLPTAKQVTPGEKIEPNGSKSGSDRSDLHPKSGKSERFIDKLIRSTIQDHPPAAETPPPKPSPLMSRIENSRASLLKPKARRKSKHFPCRAPVLDCDELLASAAGKRLADPAVAPPQQRPGVALVIKKRWCDKIFDGSKVWEIRGTSLAKRGRICIAQSKSQMLVGEVEVVNCLKVGRKVDGRLVPWSNSPQDLQNFIGARENLPKHCVEDLSWVPYSKVFAWVLDKKIRYAEPQPYRHKKGCIQWVKLEPGEAKPRHSFGARRRSQLGAGSRRVRSVQPVQPVQQVLSAVALRPATSNEPAWVSANLKFLEDDPDHPPYREPIDVD